MTSPGHIHKGRKQRHLPGKRDYADLTAIKCSQCGMNNHFDIWSAVPQVCEYCTSPLNHNLRKHPH